MVGHDVAFEFESRPLSLAAGDGLGGQMQVSQDQHARRILERIEDLDRAPLDGHCRRRSLGLRQRKQLRETEAAIGPARCAKHRPADSHAGDDRFALEQFLGTSAALEKQHVEVGELSLRTLGPGLGDRQPAHFDAVVGQMRRLNIDIEMAEPPGERGFNAYSQFLFDAKENFLIPERRRRQRSDDAQGGSPFEEEPGKIDALADDGAGSLGRFADG